MRKESYERLKMDVTRFDIEDVITTSELTAGDNELIGPPASPIGLPMDEF